ncbi:MAG: Rieske 2Fe-2S domain-containing protein, partial [Geminicoccaceae bacterium]
MSEAQSQPSGPDLAQGVASAQLADGAMLLGHVGDEAVLLARRGQEVFAIGATCTHYSGPLAEGLLVDDTVRCPWHHACFSLRTGEALRAPALDPVPCWRVERQGDRIFVRGKAAAAPKPAPNADVPG